MIPHLYFCHLMEKYFEASKIQKIVLFVQQLAVFDINKCTMGARRVCW